MLCMLIDDLELLNCGARSSSKGIVMLAMLNLMTPKYFIFECTWCCEAFCECELQ